MLARTVLSRRTLAASRVTQRLSSLRPTPIHSSAARSISLFPWRKPIDPTLPIYFPKPPPERSPKGSFWKKTRYAVLTFAVYYFLWQVYMSVVLDPLFDWAENEWDSLSDQEKEEMEAQADNEDADPLLFLPFPFTTKEIPQPPYKGSDPEWLSFVKVNKDTNLQNAIRSRLADTVRKKVESNPTLLQTMGGGQTKVRKFWLDIIYPPAPPPKHYVSGLIIDYDGIFWGDRSLETAAANQLNGIMYPKAVALACWTFWSVYLQKTKSEISKALGLESDPPQPVQVTWQSTILDQSNKHHPSHGSPFGGTLPPPNPSNRAPQPGSPHAPPDFASLFGKPAEGEVTLPTNVTRALAASSLTLAKNWRPADQAVTRGCIRVDGLIELQGQAALMVLHVAGWYDPQQNKFMSIKSRVKHLIRLKQRPMGGT